MISILPWLRAMFHHWPASCSRHLSEMASFVWSWKSATTSACIGCVVQDYFYVVFGSYIRQDIYKVVHHNKLFFLKKWLFHNFFCIELFIWQIDEQWHSFYNYGCHGYRYNYPQQPKDYKTIKHDKCPKMVKIDTIISHLCCELGSLKNIEF
jgi:hypothetical protein